MLIRQYEAATLVHMQLHLHGALLLKREQVVVRIHDLSTCGRLNHPRSDSTWLVGLQREYTVIDVVIHRDDERLEVLDDLVNVFHDPLNGLMLVYNAVGPKGPNRRAAKRRQQHPSHRVSERMAETTLEGLDHELSRSCTFARIDGFDTLRQHESGQIYLHIVLLSAPVTPTLRRGPANALLRVELHDQLLLYRERYVGTRRCSHHTSDTLLLVERQPIKQRRARTRLEGGLDRQERLRLGPHRNLVAGRHTKARYVHRPSVHLNVTMSDDLTGLTTALSEAHPEDDVVQPGLERDEQVLTRHARDVVRMFEEAPELPFTQSVNPLHLLLLAELHRVARLLAATLLCRTVLTGRVRAALDRALLGVALLTLQKQLSTFTTAELANGSSITSHVV